MQSAIEPNPLAETVGRYERVQTLGQGSFGFVQLGRSGTGDLAAIKVRSAQSDWPPSLFLARRCDACSS